MIRCPAAPDRRAVVAPGAVGQQQDTRAVVAGAVEPAYAEKRVVSVAAGINAGDRGQRLGKITVTVLPQFVIVDHGDACRRFGGRLFEACDARNRHTQEVFQGQVAEFVLASSEPVEWRERGDCRENSPGQS